MGRSKDVQLLLSLPSPPPRIDRPQVLRTKTHPPSQRTKGNVRDETPGKVFRTRCSTLGQEFQNEHEREKGEEDRCGGGRDICGIGGCVAAECAYTYVGGEMCMCMHACSGREHVNTHWDVCTAWVRVSVQRFSVLTGGGQPGSAFPSGVSRNFTHHFHETVIDISTNCLVGRAKLWAKPRGAAMVLQLFSAPCSPSLQATGHPRNLFSAVSVS